MTIFFLVVFVLSLLGVVGLFALKYREMRAGYVFVPSLKEAGDTRALDFKQFLARCRAESSTWLPKALLFVRYLLHRGALSLAALARALERQSHRLADLVSHKRGFERRETRSKFLREVSEFKSGGAQESSDIR